MALFENFPYTNLHELNLDWLINEIKKIESTQVLSVNGQTGEVILYQDAQMLLPSVTDDHWSIGRMTDGTYRGIMFGNDDKAYIVHGNLMAQLYSVNNPPAYPVRSVNGQTGDVVLYSDAQVRFPDLTDAQLHTWNMWRYLNNTMSGIEFDDTGKAYLIVGTNRYQIYTSNDQPTYPVTSVNNQTGDVTLNIPDAFVDNPAASELTIAEDIPDSSVWALLRETENGYVGIAVNNGVNPAAYLQIGTGATAQRIQLLTSADIPQSAGVVSINGLTGVVLINGSQIEVSGSDSRSIAAALAALNSAISAVDSKTGADINVSGTDTRKIDVVLSGLESDVSGLQDDRDYIKAAFVYDEQGNTTAAHNIPAGSFVYWNNGCYTASSAISVGDTLSSTNLSAVPAGGAVNVLNNKLTKETDSIVVSTLGGTVYIQKFGEIVTLEYDYGVNTSSLSINTEYLLGTLAAKYRPNKFLSFPVICADAAGHQIAECRLNVETNGKIKIKTCGSLSGNAMQYFTVSATYVV